MVAAWSKIRYYRFSFAELTTLCERNGIVSKKSMARATVIVAVLGVLSKIMGFMREQLVAWFFGATGLTDAYVVALAIPTLLTGLISNPVCTAFLPVFASYVAQDDHEGASRIASSVTTLSVGTFLLVGIASIPFAPALVRIYAPGFSGSVFDSAVSLTRLFFPGFALPLLAGLFKSMLNTYKQFSIPGVAPLVQNLFIVVLVTLLAPTFGIRGLAIATIVGYLAHVCVQWPSIRKLELDYGLSLEINKGTKQVMNLALPLTVGGLATQLYTLVDKNLASRLPSGSIAVLNWADRMRSLPTELFVAAVITVIYPSLSEMWARKDRTGMGDTLIMGTRYALFVCIPSAIGLAVLATPITRIVFERGAFAQTATLLTANALSVYSFGIMALAISRLVSVAFYSSQNTWYPVLLALGTSCLNIVFDLILVGPLGHLGLALANVLASWVGAILGLKLYTDHISQISYKELVQSGSKIVASASVMGVWAGWLAKYTGFLNGTGNFKKDLLMAIIVIGSSALLYLGGAFALKCEEIVLVTNLVRQKLGRS